MSDPSEVRVDRIVPVVLSAEELHLFGLGLWPIARRSREELLRDYPMPTDEST